MLLLLSFFFLLLFVGYFQTSVHVGLVVMGAFASLHGTPSGALSIFLPVIQRTISSLQFLDKVT